VPEDKERVILQAEALEYVETTKRLVASGNVRVTYGDKRLMADQLELYTDSNTGIAWGHVRFVTPEDDLEATRLDFDFNTERGVLYAATGKVTKYHIAGARIERLEPRVIEVQHGRVTSCTSKVPEWEFRAPDAHIGLGDYMTMKHPTFWIKGIPVFYVPYFIFPIKDKRTTGFLPPHVGLNNQFGAIVGGEFYWAPTDWLDATVGMEYLSKSGVKPEVEVRYALDPESDGQLTAAFLHDRKTDQDLWRILLRQRQDFGWGIRGISQIDARSDTDIVRRFSQTIAEESAIRTASFASLTKLFPFGGVTLQGASYDGIPESGSSEQFRYLPRVSWSQFPTALPGGFLWALDTSYARLNTSNILANTPVQRLDVFPRLALPLLAPPWFGLTLTGGVHETLYDHRVTGEGWISRQVPEVRMDVDGPSFRRRFTGLMAGQTLIHVVTPGLAYRYVPSVFQDGLPPFSALDEDVHFLDPLNDQTLIDRIQAANYTKIFLSNRVYAQSSTSAGVRSVREVAHLLLSQGLDFRQVTDGSGQPVGPLDMDLTLRLWSRWWLDSSLRLAPTTATLQEILWRGGLNLWSGSSLTLTSYQRQDPRVQYLQGAIQMTLLEGLRLSYNVRYDVLSDEVREHAVMMHYQGVCYKIDAVWRTRKAGTTDFIFQINLFNL
jgi:LPS-assembly protein